MKGAIGIDADLRYDLYSYVDGREVPSDMFLDVADEIASPIEVDQNSGHIPEIFAGDGERYVSGDRNEDGSYQLLTWKIGDLTFKTSARGWELATDNVSGLRLARLIDVEEKNTVMLYETYKLGKNYRVSVAAQKYSSYGINNKKTISLAINNYYTGSNCRDDLDDVIAPRFFATKGLEKEDLVGIFPITFIRKFIYIDDVREQMKFTSPIDKLKFKQRLELLADYLGIKKIIPVSGRFNTANFKSLAPAFSRLWDQNYIVYADISNGGVWDKKFMRQPFDTIATQGNEYMYESYDLIQNDQTRLRLKHVSGEVINYDSGFIVKDFNSVGT